jgi:2,4-dienoyl-CoA reductase-like NADH-dependent reductase (Old Yellow Enzyme family)
MPGSFDNFTLKGVTLRNRIAASPRCQYRATNGLATDWHLPHCASLALARGHRRIRAREDRVGRHDRWLITNARDADRFVREGKVDFVMLARRFLDNPHWPQHAARELEIAAQVQPTPYACWLQRWSPA